MLVFGFMLNWSLVYAGDFYVIPVKKCCTCKGTLVGTRWCDNGDGTVTDMTTCLVWLKKADWGGSKKCEDCTTHDDAHTRAGLLCAGGIIMAGDTSANLHDGSVVGDWRLPTKTELYELTHGRYPVEFPSPRAFTGLGQFTSFYWTSTTCGILLGNDSARAIYVRNGGISAFLKNEECLVWPVRSGN